jgi:hypothetical protein
MKLLGIINVAVDVTDQLLIKFLTFVKYWRGEKMGHNETTSVIPRLQESI